jgi:hypothetical protein
MDINSRVKRQMLLISSVVLMIPMIIFPERLGTMLAKASFAKFLLEIAFYVLIIYFFNRKAPLANLMKSAILCILYRFGLGAIFGLLIVLMYSMNFSVAITLGTVSYIPAIVLHIIVTPFIVRPIFSKWLLSAESEDNDSNTIMDLNKVGVTSFVATKENVKVLTLADSDSEQIQENSQKEAEPIKSGDNGFAKAVKYIGEDGSVMVAAVIDNEGLLLSNFKRGNIEIEDLSPFANLLIDKNVEQLNRLGLSSPEKIEYVFDNRKLVIANENEYLLMVVSERTADDVLNIRINQGLEIIRNFVANRYSEKLIGNAERSYV